MEDLAGCLLGTGVYVGVSGRCHHRVHRGRGVLHSGGGGGVGGGEGCLELLEEVSYMLGLGKVDTPMMLQVCLKDGDETGEGLEEEVAVSIGTIIGCHGNAGARGRSCKYE